jgi:membrane protein implicated in regulation of membrane protease activity
VAKRGQGIKRIKKETRKKAVRKRQRKQQAKKRRERRLEKTRAPLVELRRKRGESSVRLEQEAWQALL